MKYGFILPHGDVHTTPKLAERVVAAGWDAVFTPDSISIETEQYPATGGMWGSDVTMEDVRRLIEQGLPRDG